MEARQSKACCRSEQLRGLERSWAWLSRVAQKTTAMSVKAGMGAGRTYAEQRVGQWRVSGKGKHHELSRAQERHKKRKGKRKGGTDRGTSGPREGCL